MDDQIAVVAGTQLTPHDVAVTQKKGDVPQKQILGPVRPPHLMPFFQPAEQEVGEEGVEPTAGIGTERDT